MARVEKDRHDHLVSTPMHARPPLAMIQKNLFLPRTSAELTYGNSAADQEEREP